MQTVVAAHPQATALIGDMQMVMGIGHRSVHGVLVIVDGVVVESLQPVALKDLPGSGPVGLTVFHLIYISMVVVREFVEGDVQHIIGT